ncbi:hypothetical protein AVEN_273393-1 [Araneus ventricosus]|uniref:Uncharacterized protein n=1 Tax=Araneus ventricosus TaxID=182803 RepID=A0A4Y2TUH3_ARAVE|nr:hypothetical protein AVEN_273393-1 [Araneus ventricosus]
MSCGLKGTNLFLVKDSNSRSDSPFGLRFGLPLRIRTPRSDSASVSLYGSGLPVPIRTPRSRMTEKVLWVGGRRRQRKNVALAGGRRLFCHVFSQQISFFAVRGESMLRLG